MPDMTSELIARLEVVEQKLGIDPTPGFTAAEKTQTMPEEEKPFTSAIPPTPTQQATLRAEEHKGEEPVKKGK